MTNDFDTLTEKIQETMARLRIPGVAVGLWHGGQEYTAGFGITNIAHPLPVTPDTLFQIGSVTKTFVGTAAMRLVEMGQLDLDAPLRVYLPHLRLADESVAARVTMRHLLTHTSGWVGDYFDNFGNGDDAILKIIDRVATLPQVAPLGELWSYNNAGFYLAARVIEVLTGQTFEKAMKTLIFEPLGLRMAFFYPDDEILTHRFVVGHDVIGDELQILRPWALPRASAGAGGIVSTVKDLLTYARFHAGDGTAPDGTRLLTAESLTHMQTPRFHATGVSSMGLTWFIASAGEHKLIRHGGATNGHQAEFTLAPEAKFACVILCNAERGRELNAEINQWALKHYLGSGFAEAPPLDPPADQLTQYVGHYEAAANACELSAQDGKLILQVIDKGGFPTPATPPSGDQPPPVPIALYAADRWVALDPPFKGNRGEFIRAADGGVAWMRFGSRVHKRAG